jgi:hypothetical protein
MRLLLILMLLAIALSGCAAPGPGEHARVKDQTAAIAIGQKKCIQEQAEALRNDWPGEIWKAWFDPSSGYWWVSKPVSFSPPRGPRVIGLRVLVNATSADATSCDLEYMVEY